MPKTFDKDTNFETLIYWGDVSVCSLQILMLLKYEQILLLGCDCNYIEKDN